MQAIIYHNPRVSWGHLFLEMSWIRANPHPTCGRKPHVPPSKSRACGGGISCWRPTSTELPTLSCLTLRPGPCSPSWVVSWSEALFLINWDLSFPTYKGGNWTKCSSNHESVMSSSVMRPHCKCASRTGEPRTSPGLRGAEPQARELQWGGARRTPGAWRGWEGRGVSDMVHFTSSSFVLFKHKSILQMNFSM